MTIEFLGCALEYRFFLCSWSFAVGGWWLVVLANACFSQPMHIPLCAMVDASTDGPLAQTRLFVVVHAFFFNYVLSGF